MYCIEQAASDLIVESINMTPTAPVAGNNVTFNVKVKNQGSLNSAGFWVNFYFDGEMVSQQSTGTIGLAAGASKDMDPVIWTAPTAWTHTFKAVADPPFTGGPNGWIAESNEANNDKTVSFTVSPGSSPTPVPCTLTSASWNNASNPVTEGTTVYLKANTSGDCLGKGVMFAVWEADTIGSDPVRINPSPIAVNNGTAQSTWISEYQPDGLAGIADPPEYYFEASIDGSSTIITSSDPKLQVTAVKPFTPAISLNTSCIPSGTTTYSNSELTISWTNPVGGSPVSWVDISPDPGFTNSYHKDVSGTTSTPAPIGFNGYQGVSGALLAQPNSIYYVRLFNGTHSNTSSFTIPSCPQPSPSPVCREGVKVIGYALDCGKDKSKSKSASYTCYDGYSSKVGDGKKCATNTFLMDLAKKACQGHISCTQ